VNTATDPAVVFTSRPSRHRFAALPDNGVSM
jgi:hypothetical protein